ncbi:hypothetical protein BDV33DRAFT_210183 [Aspergillus novoparasiticus]|uniref:NDT80 domain-containing protein n=1 Tax=Aspergillus novoparasiticus TaxID=986946 RepID=A0A5N6E7B0_9EURO|nr:hypothetical protein BDV33DRAFT_210183 [Aspergillus novoparasiticus]
MEHSDTTEMPYATSPLMPSILRSADCTKSSSDKDIPGYGSEIVPEEFVNEDNMTNPRRDLLPPSKFTRPGRESRSYHEVPLHSPLHPQRQQSDTSVENGSRLLIFSKPVYKFILLDRSLRQTTLSLSAQLHGLFCYIKSPLSTHPAEDIPPQPGAAIICYRRNMFHITGMVILPRSLGYVITDQDGCIPIHTRELSISVIESRRLETVNLELVPLKARAANIAFAPANSIYPCTTEKTFHKPHGQHGPRPIPLDIMVDRDQDSGYVTLPITWKRLQFRTATAKNPKKKELQQYFIVKLEVVATLSTGAKVPICEVRSGPIIVRGRSPSHFHRGIALDLR